MSEAMTADEQVAAIYEYAAGLMKAGKKPDEVRDDLQMRGLHTDAAVTVVEQLVAAKKAAAQRSMLYGALWCGGGLLFTAFTYAAAEPGGTYMVATGAILVGAYQCIRGFIGSL